MSESTFMSSLNMNSGQTVLVVLLVAMMLSLFYVSSDIGISETQYICYCNFHIDDNCSHIAI